MIQNIYVGTKIHFVEIIILMKMKVMLIRNLKNVMGVV